MRPGRRPRTSASRIWSRRLALLAALFVAGWATGHASAQWQDPGGGRAPHNPYVGLPPGAIAPGRPIVPANPYAGLPPGVTVPRPAVPAPPSGPLPAADASPQPEGPALQDDAHAASEPAGRPPVPDPPVGLGRPTPPSGTMPPCVANVRVCGNLAMHPAIVCVFKAIAIRSIPVDPTRPFDVAAAKASCHADGLEVQGEDGP